MPAIHLCGKRSVLRGHLEVERRVDDPVLDRDDRFDLSLRRTEEINSRSHHHDRRHASPVLEHRH
jgi:predicted RNA-binding protein with RPS1 domain